jgi:Tfp pilus assembly protein PilW
VLSRGHAGEAGFTLVELLIAMTVGIVILLATFGVIDLTIRDNSRITDRVQATNSGRSFMEQTIAELNSGCLVPDVSPIQPATPAGISPAVTSDATHLVFVSGLGDSQSNTPTLHVLSWSNNQLTDSSYDNTGGSGPTTRGASTWTFVNPNAPGPAPARVLSNVPAFSLSYYSFPNTANAPVNSLNGAVALSLPLATTWPATSTEVNHPYQVSRLDIAMTVGPDAGDSQWGAGTASVRVNLASTAVFRLTPPSALATNYPCD